jgi:hypothetical protein
MTHRAQPTPLPENQEEKREKRTHVSADKSKKKKINYNSILNLKALVTAATISFCF